MLLTTKIQVTAHSKDSTDSPCNTLDTDSIPDTLEMSVQKAGVNKTRHFYSIQLSRVSACERLKK